MLFIFSTIIIISCIFNYLCARYRIFEFKITTNYILAFIFISYNNVTWKLVELKYKGKGSFNDSVSDGNGGRENNNNNTKSLSLFP